MKEQRSLTCPPAMGPRYTGVTGIRSLGVRVSSPSGSSGRSPAASCSDRHLPRAQIRKLASDRDCLHQRYPGVYAYGRPDLSEQGEMAAALLFAGTGSDLTGLSGLWWLGYLAPPARPDPPRRTRCASDPARTSASTTRSESSAWRSAASQSPPSPALLLLASTDLSPQLPPPGPRPSRAYDQTLSLPSLQSALSEAPRGTRALRAAMDAHLPQLAKCANEFERNFVLLCESLPPRDPRPERADRPLPPRHALAIASPDRRARRQGRPLHPRPAPGRRHPPGLPRVPGLHGHPLHLVGAG